MPGDIVPAGWQFDELAHAGTEHLDPSYVAGYDRKAANEPGPDLALLIERGLDSASTLVDIGAGTGAMTLAAAAHCRHVVAVDPSAAMLAALREKAARDRVANVQCVRAGFLSYRHEGPPADFAYSRNALHHLPDFWKALALERVAAMLRPGGVFLLRDLVFGFDPGAAIEAIEAWLANAADHPEDGWTRAELETHLRDEHSTFTWVLEPMLDKAGFVIDDASSRVGIYAAYVCTRRR